MEYPKLKVEETILGKHHWESCSLQTGIAQIAIAPPPLHSNGHSGALVFGHYFYHFEGLYASGNGNIWSAFIQQWVYASNAWGKALWKKHKVSYRHKSPKPSWQPSWPPHNQTNAHFSWGTSSLNKCPKPSGQAFRQKQGYTHLNCYLSKIWKNWAAIW